jgi:CheY-like chemotaxis protein
MRRARPTTVLLVEDNDDTRQLYAVLLADAGLTVLEAENGKAAVAMMSSRAHAPDVVVSAVGMDGGEALDLCRRLRARSDCRSVPMLLLTGSPVEPLLTQAADAGVCAVQSKPCGPLALLALVEELLSRSPQECATCQQTRDGCCLGRRIVDGIALTWFRDGH